MSETGSVKFQCEHIKTELTHFPTLDELNRVRRRLRELRMVGVDTNGIGFGNLSVRDGAMFYITGSATGGKADLTPADCAKVVAYNFEKNWLRCEGATIASSESLTHATVYESDPLAGAVIHVHELKLWKELLNKAPTTPGDVEYGTPEMAYAVRKLFETTNVKRDKIFVMSGHEGGVVAFGKDLKQALGRILATRVPAK